MPRVVAHPDAIEIMRKLDARPRLAARPAAAFSQAIEQLFDRLNVLRKFRPGPSDVEQAVIVAAPGSRLLPGLGPGGGKIVDAFEPADFRGVKIVQQRLE